MAVALPLVGEAVGAVLRGTVREQQAVRHVVAADRRQVLLPEVGRPAEPRQHRPDQVVLGLALVGGQVRGEAVQPGLQRGLKVVKGRRRHVVPVGKLIDRFPEETLREEATVKESGHR